LLRLADQKCLACGCTCFSVHEAAHNACGLCRGFEVTQTEAAAQLRHAKEDAAAATAKAAGCVDGALGDEVTTAVRPRAVAAAAAQRWRRSRPRALQAARRERSARRPVR